MLVCYEGRFERLTMHAVTEILGANQKDGFLMAHSYDGVKISSSTVVVMGGKIFFSDELTKRLGPLGRNDLFQVILWPEGRTPCFNVTAANHPDPDAVSPRRCTLPLEE